MLKHGILGLINNGDKTGYEVMTVFRDSLNHFWTAQTSQIYRELQTMEKAGWIRQTRVTQNGKPDKNVFSITPDGHEELLRWLREQNLPAGNKNPFLMKTFFMGELPVEENIAFSERFRTLPFFPTRENRCPLMPICTGRRSITQKKRSIGSSLLSLDACMKKCSGNGVNIGFRRWRDCSA